MTSEESIRGLQGSDTLKALERFVVENDDLLALESLIGRFNIFDALGIKDAEIRHSNFLAFLLDPAESHGHGQLFLKAILMDLLKIAPVERRPLSPIDLDGTDLRGVEIRREWKHIDLLIICREPRFVIVIENKVLSKEGVGQLTKYENVMREQFPKDEPLYVFLTLDADEPSTKNWMPYRHADIYRVLKRVRETNGNAIGDDVLVFLDHYLNLIGFRFMNDSDESEKIDKLCQRIYKNHRQALDLIWDRVGSLASGLVADIASDLEQHPDWEFIARSNCIDLMPKTWLNWLPRYGKTGDERWWIFVRLLVGDGKLTHAVEMAPMQDFEKRTRIETELRSQCTAFELKPAKSHGKEVKNNQSRITTAETFFSWNEEAEPEADQLRNRLKETLDKLYPKLEKLAVSLKPLCG